MINSSKSNILTYAIILLLVVNIIVIGLLLFQKYTSNRSMGCCPSGKTEMIQNKCLSEFLEKDLKFSKNQMQQFTQLKNDFQLKTNLCFDSLDLLENQFFSEINKPQADTTKLYSYANKFGRIQSELKHQTIEHLIKIKAICNTEQQKMYFDHIMKNRRCHGGMDIRSIGKHGCPNMKNNF
jgi:periplasmic protein CpxP/Spy